MNKILIFQQKTVCYSSYLYFGAQLTKELSRLGFEIEQFGPKEPIEHAERYCGRSFSAILAFNSDLPRVTMDDGRPFLDTIHAPFYDIILDHPLYHHDSLKVALHDFHVICLDENHKRYIEQFYPHIKDVHVIEMTGSMAYHQPPAIQKRRFDVLFSGTYTPPQEIADAIACSPDFIKKNSSLLIEQLEKNPSQTLEDALEQFAKNTGDSMVLEYFPLHMQAYFLVDSYLRAKKRDLLIRTLLRARIPVTVCGEGWDALDCENREYLQTCGSLSMEDSFQMMAASKILLNQMPEFKAGGHDRIYSGLLNGCVTVTDPSSMLLSQFSQGKELIFYQPDSLDDLPVLIRSLLSNPAQMQEIADAGFDNASRTHTWAHRAKQFADLL